MDERMRLLFILISLAMALVGLFFAISGILRLVRERSVSARAVRVPGTAIAFNRRRVGRYSGYGYDFPVVRYAPRGGPEIAFESPTGSSPRVHLAGRAATVLDDPNDSQRAQI